LIPATTAPRRELPAAGFEPIKIKTGASDEEILPPTPWRP
jgi:hypothetical protein